MIAPSFFGSVLRVPSFASYGFVVVRVRACSLRVSIVLFFFRFSGSFSGEEAESRGRPKTRGGRLSPPSLAPLPPVHPPSPAASQHLLEHHLLGYMVCRYALLSPSVSIAFSMHTRG